MLQWLIGEGRDNSQPGQGDTPLIPCEQGDGFDKFAFPSLLGQVERMAQMGFWRFDIENNAVFWSPQMFAIHGLPVTGGADVRKALSHVLSPQRIVLERSIYRAITEGESYDLELDLIAENGEQKRLRAMAEPEWVNGRITAIVGVIQDISKRHHLEEELRAAATTDPLTGMPNRRHMEMFYRDSRLDRDRRSRTGFALAIIDLDNFKEINDELGHAAGDYALMLTSKRLQSSWLSTCFAARLGGDEFVLLVTQSELMDDLGGLCERMLAELREPSTWNGQPLNFSATIGVAVSEWGRVSVGDMLECADAALYVAKNKGRGSAAITTREDMFLGRGSTMETVHPSKVA